MIKRTLSLRLGLVFLATLVAMAAAPLEPPRFGSYSKIGAGDTTLILVPCLGCDGRAWDEFMTRNADRYTMYAVTWPGMGTTELPDVSAAPGESPLWSYILEAMTTLMDEQEIADAVLVGHSAAGPYVVQYGQQHPERVRGVVSVDATITNWDTFGFSPRQREEWAAEEMRQVLEQYDDDDAWAALNAAPNLPDPARSAFYGDMWTRPPRSHVLAYWREWLAADSGILIDEYPRPLLALFAIRSSDDTPEATRRDRLARYERAGASPHVRVEFIEDAGHSIWEWQAVAFDDAIAAFVDSLE